MDAVLDAVLAADLDDCAEPPRGDPLIIGYAADLSEAAGYADIPGTEAAAHYIDLINCTGGADGVPVELVVEDVQGGPAAAQQATANLIDAGAHVILGPPFADSGASVLATADASRAVIFVGSTEPTTRSPSPSRASSRPALPIPKRSPRPSPSPTGWGPSPPASTTRAPTGSPTPTYTSSRYATARSCSQPGCDLPQPD